MPQEKQEQKKQVLALVQSGNLQNALEICAKACADETADAEFWLLQAFVRFQLKQLTLAEVCCRKSLEKAADNPEAYNLLGSVMQHAGRLEEAIDNFRKVLSLSPGHVVALFNLATVSIAMGNLKAALDNLAQVVAVQPEHAQAWFLMGAIEGQGNNYDNALQCSLKAIANNPDHVDAHYNAAQAYMHQEKLADAARHFQEVVRRRPDHFDAINNLGIALQEQGKIGEAVSCFREALKLRPDFAPTQYVLAALEGTSEPSEAPPEYVQQLFDKYADRFDKHLVGALEYRTPELLNEELRRVLRANEDRLTLNILDIGCGTGLFGPLIRDIAVKLVGVDLSPKMVEKAREKGIYDELLVGDITQSLLDKEAEFDMVVAVDVFPYVGDLEGIFNACKSILSEGGLFAFSTESVEQGEPYVLRDTSRYAHSADYLRALARETGFSELALSEVAIRKKKGKPVMGYLVVFGV